jgi:hypothetical protein
MLSKWTMRESMFMVIFYCIRNILVTFIKFVRSMEKGKTKIMIGTEKIICSSSNVERILHHISEHKSLVFKAS